MPRVKFTPQSPVQQGALAPDRWNVRPGGDKNLLRHLSAVIRCKTKPFADSVNNWEPSILISCQLTKNIFPCQQKNYEKPSRQNTLESGFLALPLFLSNHSRTICCCTREERTVALSIKPLFIAL